MAASPILYEINTRCWLARLSGEAGRPLTLGSVPEEELRDWVAQGFTHIWLMGIWRGGPIARAQARVQPSLRKACEELGASPDALDFSPYAISGYAVSPDLGTPEGLRAFRGRLHHHGLRLMLDFIPNHTGLDHPWVETHPEYFVQGGGNAPGVFTRNTARGKVFLAHGKDPYFPPWKDTVQLDLRVRATREALAEELLKVADMCDGVRCDMAMLVLSDVFARTWQNFPPGSSSEPGDFWPEAISRVKALHPGFLFLAEAYWGLEPALMGMGFDYVYDKTLTDLLLGRESAKVVEHIRDLPPGVLEQGAHFLENHDERRVSSQLDLEHHRAAALLVLSLPGVRFLHEGQLAGARQKLPVQLRRAPAEAADAAIAAMYTDILGAVRRSHIHRGAGRWLGVVSVGDGTPAPVVVTQWRDGTGFTLAVVNLAPETLTVSIPIQVVNPGTWQYVNLLAPSEPKQTWLHNQPLTMRLNPLAAKVLSFLQSGETTAS